MKTAMLMTILFLLTGCMQPSPEQKERRCKHGAIFGLLANEIEPTDDDYSETLKQKVRNSGILAYMACEDIKK